MSEQQLRAEVRQLQLEREILLRIVARLKWAQEEARPGVTGFIPPKTIRVRG